jgi:hypothetical protein
MENIRAFNKRIDELINSGQTQEAAALMESRVTLFWIEEYPKKNYNERINHWVGEIGRQLRWNEESGIDTSDYFSNLDVETWREIEPRIDEIISKVRDRLNR